MSGDARNLLDLVPEGRYVAPSAWPVNSVCRLLVIPDDPQIKAALHELMTRITSPDAWRESGLTPDDAAALCSQMWLDYVENAHCMPSFCSMIGTILPYASRIPPVGCLRCDGTEHLRVHYPRLYEALDPQFIVDDDRFVTPDLRGRFVLGTPDGGFPGTFGGAAEVNLTVDQLPAHTHTTQPHTHSTMPHHHAHDPVVIGDLDVEGVGVPQPTAAQIIPFITENTYDATVAVNSATVTVDQTGGGQPVNILPPYTTINYCIVAGWS